VDLNQEPANFTYLDRLCVEPEELGYFASALVITPGIYGIEMTAFEETFHKHRCKSDLNLQPGSLQHNALITAPMVHPRSSHNN